MSSELEPLFILPRLSSPELSFHLLAAAVLLAAILALCSLSRSSGLAWALSRPGPRHPIPGPAGHPVVGLGPTFRGPHTHRVLKSLADAFNAKKLMSFSIGFTRFIISSDADTARELLNSSAFADRPVKESAYELLFHRAMGFAPYGDYWRNLRRISAAHLFSPRRVSSSGPVRVAVGLDMAAEIKKIMSLKGEVEVRRVLHFGSLNNVMATVFGRRYNFNGKEGAELESLVSEGYELLGIFNWSDHFPILGFLDPQGIRRRCRKLAEQVNIFVGKIIEEHKVIRRGGSDGDEGDFVDVLLGLEKENRVADSDMVAVLWEMIFRGTDTVAILLEWILARMVLHPEIQARARSEIDAVVGPAGRQVSDSDLPNLPYLRAIVKETLRMHPPGPLLSWARLAIHDTSIGPHFIPAGTTAMVNMWAITNDEEVWAEPDEFKPERFLREEVSIMGSDLRMAPFGAGRRVCPGKAMGLATVELWLAQLLQNFKWVPSVSHGVDLSERLKLSMEMEHSLMCKAISMD